MKEDILSSQLIAEHNISSDLDKLALLVHSTFITNGFWPVPQNDIEGVSLLNPDWHPSEHLYVFQYIGGIEVKCVALSESVLSVNAMKENEIFSIKIRLGEENLIGLIKSNLVYPLNPIGQPQPVGQPVRQPESVGYAQPVGPPPVGRYHPRAGHHRHPGELVGPNDPIFTGGEDSRGTGRYDPIGPGNIGEPWNDEFPPPGFGQPPRSTGRTPLRGPGANLGPGDMFM